jgi:GNAT superfamily N-acetyltransferase
MTTLLRQATRDDIPALWDVRYTARENTLRRRVVTDEDVRREIEDTGRGWVVEQDGIIIAFAIGNWASGNVWALFVHPDFEGRGHGSRLHDTMIRWLWSQGVKTLWLTTGAKTQARKFYESKGWHDMGLIDNGDVRYELQQP